MFTFLRLAKNYLSHVQNKSWHYRLVEWIWDEKRLTSSKACTYYWIKLPASFCVAGFLALAAIVWYLVGGICGFVPAFVPSSNPEMLYQKGEIMYPYKRFPNGWKMPLAPWEIALIAVGFYSFYYSVYYTFVFDFWPGLWLVIGVALLSLLMFGIYVLTKSWKTGPFVKARLMVKEAWDRVCPPLVIEHDDKDSKSEED